MKDFPYSFRIPKHQLSIKIQWCKETFGPRWDPIKYRIGVWTVFWGGFANGPDYYIWHFKNEKDAALFALRWGS